MSSEEEALIRAFVVSSKQERYLGLLTSAKRRRKLLDALYHFDDFEPAWQVAIAASQQRAEEIGKLLEARGAPERCYAVSTIQELDQRRLGLAEALQRIVGGGADGTLLSCIPGRLAYFEGESPGDRFILERRQ